MVRAFLPDLLDSLVRMAQWMASSSFPSPGYLTQRVSLSISLLPQVRRSAPPRNIERSLPNVADAAVQLNATLEATHQTFGPPQHGAPTMSADSASPNPDCRGQTPSHSH